MFRPTNLFARSVAVAAFVGGLAVSPALYAATAQDDAAMKPAATTEAPAKASKPHQEMSSEERIEARIKELHEKLKITDEQKDAWATVADTMRDNEKSVHELIKERHEKDDTRTALEDLESYQKIAAAHAEGLGKFIQVFQPLYDSMSDAQKKNADTVFGNFEGHGRHKGRMEGKSATKAK